MSAHQLPTISNPDTFEDSVPVMIKKELLDDIYRDVTKLLSSNLRVDVKTLYFASTSPDHTEIDECCEGLKTDYCIIS